MSDLHESALVYDWNMTDADAPLARGVRVIDETLYEAVHAASALPDAGAISELLRCMPAIGISEVGLGALSASTLPEIVRRARLIAEERLPLAPACVVDAVSTEVDRVAHVLDASGGRLTVTLLVQASSLQQRALGQAPDRALADLEGALEAAARCGADSALLLHDAGRAHPAPLRRIVNAALGHGVERVCLWDSAGRTSPRGAGRLVAFMRRVAAERDALIQVGWFGRNDRDLALASALEARRRGADALHATALGLGHGAGCVPIDLLLANLLLLEVIDSDLSALKQYCDLAARAFGFSIPASYPVFGGDAFRTATGVHAAAIIKARDKGDHWLADRVYSSVPAGLFGLHQIIDVGPMSGESNAVAWLRHHGFTPQPELVKRIIARAKASKATLTAEEMREEIQAFGLLAESSR